MNSVVSIRNMAMANSVYMCYNCVTAHSSKSSPGGAQSGRSAEHAQSLRYATLGSDSVPPRRRHKGDGARILEGYPSVSPR